MKYKPKKTEKEGFTVPYYVAAESCRLLAQMVKNCEDNKGHDEFLSSFHAWVWNFVLKIQNYGPIASCFPGEALPPFFSSCQDENEVRMMNIQLQQELIQRPIYVSLEQLKSWVPD